MSNEGYILTQDQEDELSKSSSHETAVAFVETHRDILESYARGQVNIEPAPAELDTFAFNLENNTIYINSRFYQNLGFSEEKTTFATLHELEHFLEKKAMLAEDGGEEAFGSYLGKIKSSRAWGLMDNCIADIRENRAVTQKAPSGFREIEQVMYRDDLFPDSDMSSAPMHIQLPQALLRESRLPNEMCIVSPEVREKIDQIKSIVGKKGDRLLDVMTHPETPMSLRVKLQDHFIWPLIEELRKKDEEKEKEKEKEKQKNDREDGEEDGKDAGENGKKNDKPGKSKDKGGEGYSGENSEAETNPDEIFKEAYNKASKSVPNAVSIPDIEKAFKEWQDKQEGGGLDRADKNYAEKLGVKKEDLQKYRKIVEELNKVRNPETNETIVEELRQLIERIISRRLKPRQAPKYPVDEGEELSDPAQLVADAKAGNFESKVWETDEIKQRQGKRFGEIEITLICDRSSSMNEGKKLVEQRKATVFLMEALRQFSERTEEEIHNIDTPLLVRSEVRSFQSSQEDTVPIKKMSKELSEKERIDVMAKISSAPGSTTDFVALENIRDGIDEKTANKIESGEMKKIVIVFTDGESDNKSRVGKVLSDLRAKGVEVIGIGVTEDGRSALTTYAPDARLAEQAEKLSVILGDVLKDSLVGV